MSPRCRKPPVIQCATSVTGIFAPLTVVAGHCRHGRTIPRYRRTSPGRLAVSSCSTGSSIGAMGAELALSLMFTDFSIELTGLAVAVGYVGVYAGFAHANARSPPRRDPQVMFVLGATGADRPDHRGHDAADLCRGVRPTCRCRMPICSPSTARSVSTGRPMSRFVDDHPALASLAELRLHHDPLADLSPFRSCWRRCAAIGASRNSPSRSALALVVTTIISGAGAGDRRVSADRARSRQRSRTSIRGAYLDQLRDLPPTRDGVLRHLELLGLGGIVTFPSFHAASAVLYVWALWPVRWFRPYRCW